MNSKILLRIPGIFTSTNYSRVKKNANTKLTYSMCELWELGLVCGASAIPSSCRLRIFRYFWQKGLKRKFTMNWGSVNNLYVNGIFYLRNHPDRLYHLWAPDSPADLKKTKSVSQIIIYWYFKFLTKIFECRTKNNFSILFRTNWTGRFYILKIQMNKQTVKERNKR